MNRFIRITRAAATAAALLISGGCATKGDLRAVRLEMRGLAARQDSLLAVLERQSAVTQDTLRRQNDQLFEIRGDVARQLTRILDELATLTELTGQNQRSIAALRDQVERLSRGGAVAQGPGPGAGPDPVTGQVPPTGNAEMMYNAAVDLQRRGSLTTAQAAFEDFLSEFGTHELAPDAHFLLGDNLSQQDKPEDAIEAFGKIPELFPTHSRVPDALYRMGLLYIEVDEDEEAERAFDRIVNSYPASDVAGLAREQLRELR